MSDVPVRHMRFDFDPSTMAKYCWKDDAFSSAFILTFSALIPYGERLVIDSVRARRDEVRDPELRARVTGLIGQEAMHSKIHEEFNAAYQAKGLPMDRIEQAGEWFFNRLLPRVLDRDMQLAVTCAIEHVISLESLDRLAGFVEFLKACPLAGEGFVDRFLRCYDNGRQRLRGEDVGFCECRCEDCEP